MAEYQLLGGLPRFGLFAGYCYTINAVIGGGFLAIPWAYQTAGWGLSLVMQVIFLFLGLLLSCQLLEITSRVTALATSKIKYERVSLWTALKLGLCGADSERSPTACLSMPEPEITDELQYDLFEIVKLLMGDYWAVFYMICSSVFLLCSLTAYTNIFGTALSTYVPVFATCDYSQEEVSSVCNWQYRFFTLWFFLLMMYFSSIEFQEQRFMQIPMTVMRLLVIGSIVVVACSNLIYEKNVDNDESYEHGNPPVKNISVIGQTIPIILFALIYQPYYPGILNATQKDPKVLNWILVLVSLTLLVLYSALGMCSAFSFKKVPSNISLLFANFSNGHPQSERPIWTFIIGYLVVLFPAFDMISIFPIVAHAVSDNVMAIFYGANRTELRTKSHCKYYGFRIICILPALLYAFVSIKLGPIVNNSGLICFYLAFFAIPLLHISARYLVPKSSPYDVCWNPLVSSSQWLSAFIAIGSIPLFGLNAFTAFAPGSGV